MRAKPLGVYCPTVCIQAGTTTELNLADYFRANNMKYEVVAFEKADEVVAAYDAGRCDVYTTDQSGLYAQRIKLKLASVGIEVFLPDELGAAMTPHHMFGTESGVRVQVEDKDEELARKVLDEGFDEIEEK